MGGYAARQRRRIRRQRQRRRIHRQIVKYKINRQIVNTPTRHIYGLGIEDEFVEIMAEEFRKEIDKEILERMNSVMTLPYRPDSFTEDQLREAIQKILEEEQES